MKEPLLNKRITITRFLYMPDGMGGQTVSYNPPPAEPSWIRPSDWLALPTVTSAEDKFVGLHAIFENGDNVAALLFTTSTGSYTVDWGDGTIDTVASNVKAEHQYDFSAIPSGTTTTQGYRQVIVTVTPVSGLLRTCNFDQRFTGRNQPYSTGWLDVTLSMPNASAGQTIIFGGGTVVHSIVEQVTIVDIGACTILQELYINCHLLQSVPVFDTSSVTNMVAMFANCHSIVDIPLLDTSEVTDLIGTFQSCYSLLSPPLWNTQKVTNMQNMFAECYALVDVPLYDTGNVTDMVQMFLRCYSLGTIPLFNTVKVTTMASMFNGCRSLASVPLLDLSVCTNTQSMLIECNSLESIPVFNTSAVTNFQQMLDQMRSLRSIPALSTAATSASVGNFENLSRLSYSLSRCEMIIGKTVSFSGCGLGRDALVEIFTNLVDRSATTSATITITDNWGVASLSGADLAIATDKNWIVTT